MPATKLLTQNLGISQQFVHWIFVDGAAAPTPGGWAAAYNIESGSFEFYNQSGEGSIDSFSAEIMASNTLEMPQDSADGAQIGDPVTTLGAVEMSLLARWYKVKITDLAVSGGATLGVRFHGLSH